jgi:hypothetical protein
MVWDLPRVLQRIAGFLGRFRIYTCALQCTAAMGLWYLAAAMLFLGVTDSAVEPIEGSLAQVRFVSRLHLLEGLCTCGKHRHWCLEYTQPRILSLLQAPATSPPPTVLHMALPGLSFLDGFAVNCKDMVSIVGPHMVASYIVLLRVQTRVPPVSVSLFLRALSSWLLR